MQGNLFFFFGGQKINQSGLQGYYYCLSLFTHPKYSNFRWEFSDLTVTEKEIKKKKKVLWFLYFIFTICFFLIPFFLKNEGTWCYPWPIWELLAEGRGWTEIRSLYQTSVLNVSWLKGWRSGWRQRPNGYVPLLIWRIKSHGLN